MHEFALAQDIVDIVTPYAMRHHATHVTGVSLRVGEANHVTKDALTLCFEAVTRDNPLLAGASLQIEIIPHWVQCKRCTMTFAVKDADIRCPICGAQGGTAISGTEFEVQAIEIEQPTAAQHAE